jgi:hypothetical protein
MTYVEAPFAGTIRKLTTDYTKQEYFAAYPGMEGQSVVTDPRKILINVTKTKLNQNSRM